MKKIQLFVSLVFVGLNVMCQVPGRSKQFVILTDLGIDHFIGKNIMGSKPGVINPWLHITTYEKKNYTSSGIRLRISPMIPITSNFLLGLQTGANYHPNEQWGAYTYPLITIPVQSRIIAEIKNISNNALYIDLAGGYNFFKWDRVSYKEESGPIYTAALMYRWNNKLSVRAGYELQVDKVYSYIWEFPGLSQQYEVIDYKQRRENIFIALSYSLVNKNKETRSFVRVGQQ